MSVSVTQSRNQTIQQKSSLTAVKVRDALVDASLAAGASVLLAAATYAVSYAGIDVINAYPSSPLTDVGSAHQALTGFFEFFTPALALLGAVSQGLKSLVES